MKFFYLQFFFISYFSFFLIIYAQTNISDKESNLSEEDAIKKNNAGSFSSGKLRGQEVILDKEKEKIDLMRLAILYGTFEEQLQVYKK